MTKESSYTLLQSKKWRAITYDWDILSTNGNASHLYCLTDFQVAWLLSNTQYMRWASRWTDCPCTPGDLDKMASEMEYNLMSCFDFQPYQMQYLYDQSQKEDLAYLNNLWDGVNPDSVNPDTPNDYYSGDGSVDRENALCTACKIYVYSYVTKWSETATIALGVALVVSILSGITVVGGIISIAILGSLVYMTQDYLDAIQNTDALDRVACCMLDALNGTAITMANFETCLDACAFAGGTDEYLITELVMSDLDKLDNWLSFINQIGNSYPLAQIGVYDCPCTEDWESIVDFTVDDYGFVFQTTSGNPVGSWSNGVGLICEYNNPPDVNQLNGYLPFDTSTLTSMQVVGSFTEATGQNQSLTAYVIGLVDNAPTFPPNLLGGTSLTRLYSFFSTGVPTVVDDTTDSYEVSSNGWYVSMRPSNTSSGGTCVITTVILQGKGFKPSQLP